MTDFSQGLSQSAGQRQEQTITPQQMQSLDILTAPIQELQQKIEHELIENPVLELAEPEEADLPDLPADPADPDLGEDPMGAERRDPEEELARILESGGRDEEPSGEADSFSDPDAEERREYFFNSIPGKVSLQEHLLQQLDFADLPEKKRSIAEAVIGGMDDSGYFRTHPADVATAENCSVEEVESMLKLIQTFDPPGIGARTLSECLRLQLEESDPDYPLLVKLADTCLEEIARNRLPQAAKTLGIPLEKLQDLLKKIRALDPAPGLAFSSRTTAYIVPEATVVPEGDTFRVISNEEYQVHLRISPHYLNMLEDPATPEDVKTYLRNRITGGKGLMKALELRRSTILRITDVIVSCQHDFLKNGIADLKPMTMQEVADRIGVHETTVSRALANKYLQTPQGLLEYKFFFSGGFRREDGAAVSSRSVREILRDLIDGEDPAHPLSDQDLMALLEKQGLSVKRRTVAKYRDELGIPASHLRRKFV